MRASREMKSICNAMMPQRRFGSADAARHIVVEARSSAKRDGPQSIGRVGALGDGQQKRRIDGLEAHAIELLDAPGQGDLPDLNVAREALERSVSGRETIDRGDIHGEAAPG